MRQKSDLDSDHTQPGKVFADILNHIGTTAVGACFRGLAESGLGSFLDSGRWLRLSEERVRRLVSPGPLLIMLRVLNGLGYARLSPLKQVDYAFCLQESALPFIRCSTWQLGFQRALEAAIRFQDSRTVGSWLPGRQEKTIIHGKPAASPLYAGVMTELSLQITPRGNSDRPLGLQEDGTVKGLPPEEAGFCRHLLADPGWCDSKRDGLVLTDAGLMALQLAPQYYHTAAYLNLYTRFPSCLQGIFPHSLQEDNHLRRDIDIASSSRVFEQTCRQPVQAILQPLFDAPLPEQPDCIVDMGCGEGTLLAELYAMIASGTKRGRHLAEHPLTLIGADPSPVAREAARGRLERLGVHHHILDGDIADPGRLARQLRSRGIDPTLALHVNKSVLHNRRLQPSSAVRRQQEQSFSRNFFVWPDGSPAPARTVEDDLLRLLTDWRPLTRRHGLIIIEAHTVPYEAVHRPEFKNILACLDATHGLSAQYLLEADVFRDILARAGYRPKSLKNIGREVFGDPVLSMGHYVLSEPD